MKNKIIAGYNLYSVGYRLEGKDFYRLVVAENATKAAEMEPMSVTVSIVESDISMRVPDIEEDIVEETESMAMLGTILTIVAQAMPFWLKKWGYDEKAILKFIRDVENHTTTAYKKNNESVKEARKRIRKLRAELLIELRNQRPTTDGER